MSLTPKRLAELSPKERRALLAEILQEKGSRPHSFPLSFAQQRLWFLDQLVPGNSFYNISTAIPFTMALNLEAFQRSLNEIVRRHDSLRTTFVAIRGKPLQVISPGLDLPLPLVDLSTLPKTARETEAIRLATEEAQTPFDLKRGPLVRTSLLRLGPIDYIFLLTMHHIISDGWSLNLFFRELGTLYTAFVQGQPSPLAELPIQYADYAVWQRKWLQGEALEIQLAYWKKQLANLPILQMPTDRERPAVQTFEGASHKVVLPQVLCQELKTLSQREGVTLFMTLLAAFQTLLYRYTSQDDIVIGAPVAGRSRAELEDLIGFFINTLVLRSDLSGNPSFKEFLGRVREMALDAYAHQDLPFERLVEELKPERDLSRNPLCQVAFQLQHASTSAPQSSRPAAQMLHVERATAPFDILFSLWDSAEGISGGFDYNTDLFDATTIARMAGHFKTLLEGIVADPDQQLSELPLLTVAEQHQLLVEWNATEADYPRQICIQQIVERHADHSPEATAVVFQDQCLSYQALNQRANQLAHYLQALGVGPDVLVGLAVERSLEMVVGLLGVLKAGGAYLPLDPSYPRERLAFMLDDSRVPVILTQEHIAPILPDCAASVICLDCDWDTIAECSADNQPSTVTIQNLAYVIYTSGSTGRPKGTLIEHRGICNVAEAQVRKFGINRESRVLQFSSLSFDASVFEVMMALYSGASLYLGTPDALRPGHALIHFLQENAITVVTLPPSALTASPYANLTALQTITVAGEACPADLVARWASGRRFFNLYGPTEATIWGTVAECTDGTRRPPIGRPIANTQAYILDRHLNPVPIGVPGELYLGGVGLARGYLGRPDLTAERFVPNPFSDEPSARLYRTGDLARYLPDGTIDFLGRLDHQVKIRGYRIELGEIETVLGKHPAVREAVVVDREDTLGNKRLVAYVVPQPDAILLISELRQFLQQELPNYMIPAALVLLDAMPLTPSRKIDRRQLPAPSTTRPETKDTYSEPRNWVEEKLAEIWAQVLNVDHVGIHDNFFDLGGDSILSIQIIARANQAALQLTPKQLFQYQTIAELAEVAGTAPAVLAEQGELTGPVPLTPIQHWFFEQELVDAHHFNQTVLFHVPPDMDRDRLNHVVRHLLLHHDALRLRFIRGPEGWQQFYTGPDENVPFEYVDLSGVPAAEHRAALEVAASRFQASLNLEEGPLMRVVLFGLGAPRPGRLLIAIHHLAIDGVSWRILLDDMQAAYQQLAEGKTVELPAKTTSIRGWAERLHDYAASDALRDELPYWLELRDAQISPLPLDESGVNTAGSVSSVSISLDHETTSALLQEIPQVYSMQVNDVLLTALALTLAEWTSGIQVLIDLEGHGREPLFDDVDVSRTMGWFTSMFPVVLQVEPTRPVDEALKSIKEQLRAVPNRGIGYGLLRYLSADAVIIEQLRALPKAEVSFNYLGQYGSRRADSRDFGEIRESIGPFRSPRDVRQHLLEVGGSVAGGRLHLEWLYSENLHHRSTVEALVADYLQTLKSIIALVQSSEARGFTPSDFPKARISQQDLDKLLTRINRMDRKEPEE